MLQSARSQNLLNSHEALSSESLTTMKKLVGFNWTSSVENLDIKTQAATGGAWSVVNQENSLWFKRAILLNNIDLSQPRV